MSVKGRHSTEVAFTLRAQAARVRITAPEIFFREIFPRGKKIISLSDVAVLIDSKKDSAQKA